MSSFSHSLLSFHLSQILLLGYSFLLSTGLINAANYIFILESKSFISMWLSMVVFTHLCIYPLIGKCIFSCNFSDIKIPAFPLPFLSRVFARSNNNNHDVCLRKSSASFFSFYTHLHYLLCKMLLLPNGDDYIISITNHYSFPLPHPVPHRVHTYHYTFSRISQTQIFLKSLRPILQYFTSSVNQSHN